MTRHIVNSITLLTALGCGTIGGVFFAFSSFVMPALARLPAASGLSAMQAINVSVLNRSFLGVFVGTALAAVALGGRAIHRWSSPHDAWPIIGASLYLVGVFGVTALANVPRNDSLAALTPEMPAAARQWATYVDEWTRWNTVRTVAALLAALAFILSCTAADAPR